MCFIWQFLLECGKTIYRPPHLCAASYGITVIWILVATSYWSSESEAWCDPNTVVVTLDCEPILTTLFNFNRGMDK